MHKTRFAFVTLALLTILPTVASAQVDVGLRGGLSLFKFVGDSLTSADSVGTRTGINIGAFVNYPVSDLISIQGGVGFAQMGASATESALDAIDAKVELSYIEIQALVKISPPMSGSLGVDFFIGPAIGFEMSCKFNSSETTANLFPTGDCDSAANGFKTTSTAFSGVGGAGINYAVGDTGTLVLQGFYNYGFTNIDDAAIPDPDDPNTKNRGWSILAGFSIPVGG